MEKVIITSTVDVLDGGCNACGLVEDTIYTLTMNNIAIPIDDLTVNSLIMAITLRKGYKQELKMNLHDEYIVYRRQNHLVTLNEEENRLTYSTNEKTIETPNKITNMNDLISKVNELLTELFQIEKLEFIL